MFGQNIRQLSREQLASFRQRIGVVFQDFRLLSHLSAFDNVALPLRILGRPEKEIQNNVNELLEWVGLGEHKQMLPATMSGGQQQRVAIARAVIGRPKLLLADEPTGNLDDDIGFRLMNLFDQLNRMGTTIVIATHNPHIMEKFRHPRLILDTGRLELGAPLVPKFMEPPADQEFFHDNDDHLTPQDYDNEIETTEDNPRHWIRRKIEGVF